MRSNTFGKLFQFFLTRLQKPSLHVSFFYSLCPLIQLLKQKLFLKSLVWRGSILSMPSALFEDNVNSLLSLQ